MKRKLTICTGTACFVMGGAQLLTISETLTNDLKDVVEITGSTCLGYCKNNNNMKPPFVKVDDIVISEATVEKILKALKEEE